MDEILDEPVVNNKVYTKNTIKMASFFGSPILGAYFMTVNFKAIGKANYVVYTWLGAIVIFALALLIAYNIENMPTLILPLLYALISGFIFDKYQKENVVNLIKEGGTYYPWWRGALIILIVGLAFFIPVFLIIFQDQINLGA